MPVVNTELLEQIVPTNTVEELLHGDRDILEQLMFSAEEDLLHPVVYWQVIDVIIALILGWLIAYALKHAIHKRNELHKAAYHEKLAITGWAGVKLAAQELFLSLAWPVASLFFILLVTSILRTFSVLPNRPLPIDSAAWLILCAYIIIRIVVFAIHQTISKRRSTTRLEKALILIIWLTVALQIIGILPKIITELKVTTVPIGNSTISVWSILMATVSVLLALIITKWLSHLSEAWIMSLHEIDANVKGVIVRITKIVLILLAIFLGLTAVGLDITVLGVFGGAIGVGVGFGLQKIASNYISGFIILLDKSIQIGDLVRVDNVEGIVTDIKTRYTVVKAYDGTVTIIPNESFIATNVVNASYLRGPGRVFVIVSVDYSSDIDYCIELITKILRKEPRVLVNPEPFVIMSDFGDSGIELTAYFWVSDPETGTAGLRSNIRRKIFSKFNEENINIPFTQVDMRVIEFPELACKFETGSLPTPSKARSKEPKEPVQSKSK